MSIYRDLEALLEREVRARAFFEGLPGYAQEMVRERGKNVRTWADLRAFAENVLAGDR